jgi:hypothetical protein
MGPLFQTVPSQTTAFAMLDHSTSLVLGGILKRDALDTAVHRTREQMLAHREPLQILLSAFYPRRKRYINDFADLQARLRAIPAERYEQLNGVARDLLGHAKTELIEAMWQALKHYGQEGYARKSGLYEFRLHSVHRSTLLRL